MSTLLRAEIAGEGGAEAELSSELYGELRRIAAREFGGEQRRVTLQPTAVVHEAWLRLVHGEGLERHESAHLKRRFATVMRHVLVDAARARNRDKRGGHEHHETFVDAPDASAAREIDVLALHEALETLASLDAAKARIVELHFFGGLTWDQVADVIGLSPRTVDNEWRAARAWLERELERAR